MKIAIHHREGSFSERWIKYCDEQKLDYKLVNCYNSDIIKQLSDCDILMWHWHHTDPKAKLFTRQLTISLESRRMVIFPNSETSWHFDDKLGQKYLLEVHKVPMVPTFIFYDQEESLNWLNRQKFPIVFKLRGGAGSSNVKLITNKYQGKRMIEKSFSSGFNIVKSFSSGLNVILSITKDLKKSVRSISNFQMLINKIIKVPYIIKNIRYLNKMIRKEKGYVYFQKFIPDNNYDIRVVVIGKKAFGLKRLNRENDFRASGSGKIIYKKEEINIKAIELSFKISKELNAQCLAYDYLFNDDNNPLLIEISYGFTHRAYDACEGYWDEELTWHDDVINAPYLIIKEVIDEFNKKQKHGSSL